MFFFIPSMVKMSTYEIWNSIKRFIFRYGISKCCKIALKLHGSGFSFVSKSHWLISQSALWLRVENWKNLLDWWQSIEIRWFVHILDLSVCKHLKFPNNEKKWWNCRLETSFPHDFNIRMRAVTVVMTSAVCRVSFKYHDGKRSDGKKTNCNWNAVVMCEFVCIEEKSRQIISSNFVEFRRSSSLFLSCHKSTSGWCY